MKFGKRKCKAYVGMAMVLFLARGDNALMEAMY